MTRRKAFWPALALVGLALHAGAALADTWPPADSGPRTDAAVAQAMADARVPVVTQAPPLDQVHALLEWRKAMQAQTEAKRPKIDPAVGVNELKTVRIGGADIYVHIRGLDRRNPILVFNHGGPGTPFIFEEAAFQSPLEAHFTVVQWDQRCAGKTYFANLATVDCAAVDFERMLADAQGVVDHVKTQLGQDKVILLGHSWGSVLGVAQVLKTPGDYHAYVGMGQAVDMERTGPEIIRRIAEEAKARGDAATLKKIAAIPQVPGQPWVGRYETMMIAQAYGLNYRGNGDYSTYRALALDLAMGSPDYTLEDTTFLTSPYIKPPTTLITTLKHNTPAGRSRRFAMPVVIAMGRYDFNTPITLAKTYFDEIEAPQKRFHTFQDSAHNPMFDEPKAFADFLIQEVRPLALPARP